MVHQGLEVVGALVVLQGPGEAPEAGPAQCLLHGRHEELGPAHLRPGRRALLLDTWPGTPSDVPPTRPIPAEAAGRDPRERRPAESSAGASCSLCPRVQAPPFHKLPTPLAHSQGHASAPQGLTAPQGTFTLHTLGERWTRGEEGRKAGRRGPGFPVLSSAPLGGQAPAARPLPDSTRPLALPAASQKRGSAGSAGLPGGLAAQAVSQRVPTASA